MNNEKTGIGEWLKRHQYVASWSTLFVCLVALYELFQMGS